MGLPLLLRASAPGDPQDRPARRPRSPIHPRLLSGAAVRAVPGQHPHRALHVVARCDGERRPAQARRLHARPRRRPDPGRQDGGDRLPCGALPSRDRPGHRHRPVDRRRRIRALREAGGALSRSHPSAPSGIQRLPASQGLLGRQSLGALRERRRRRRRALRERLEHASCGPAGAGRGNALGDRVHHRSGHRLPPANPGFAALVPAPERHQAALALPRSGPPITPSTHAITFCPRCGPTASGRARTRSTGPSWTRDTAGASPGTKSASA